MNSEETIKLFGISNQLLEIGLSKVEADLDIDLQRKIAKRDEKDSVYYPQFDKSIRAEAVEMSKHYEIFYCFEKTIRKLISDSLDAVEPKTWWNSQRVPANIHAEVEKRIQREKDSGFTLRSEQPIDYTNFGELGEIIKHNWIVFGSIFDSPKAVERIMNNLNLLRNSIAHCSPLAEDEIVRLRLSVKDWFRLME
ncbi:MAG: Swt1 family HEPN domain-containing protein [Verrucomicrobiota bacterium]